MSQGIPAGPATGAVPSPAGAPPSEPIKAVKLRHPWRIVIAIVLVLLFVWFVIDASQREAYGWQYVGKYVFRFHPAILLGCCSGARTTTASLGMINDRAKSQIPGLGYTVTYAVGNTLLTIWGMVLVMLMT